MPIPLGNPGSDLFSLATLTVLRDPRRSRTSRHRALPRSRWRSAQSRDKLPLVAQADQAELISRSPYDVSVRHEDEEMTAALPDDRVQLRASPGGWDAAHQAVEAAIEVGLVDLQRAVRERLAASPDGAGALQHALQSRRENGIAGIDRVLDVADQMREADLVSQS